MSTIHLMQNQQAIVQARYDPGMMTYDGSTGYYGKNAITTSGSSVAGVARINVSAFTGSSTFYRVMAMKGTTGRWRLSIACFSSDYSTADYRNKCTVFAQNSSATTIMLLLSNVDVCDGNDHTIFISFNATTGVANFYIDGVGADDTGFGGRVLTTGTMTTGSSGEFSVGSSAYNSASNPLNGQIGYIGYQDAYLTNPTDFYHPTNGLQELDESGWTEWGSQPLFWNQYGTMTDNKGSAGNMTANGTITGPS